eukprot:1194768-Prorocentrum_minimum.AAC.7
MLVRDLARGRCSGGGRRTAPRSSASTDLCPTRLRRRSSSRARSVVIVATPPPPRGPRETPPRPHSRRTTRTPSDPPIPLNPYEDP